MLRRYLDGTAALNGASNAAGMKNRNILPICRFISETIQDRAMMTMEANKNSYAICRLVLFPMTLSDRE